MRSETIRVSVSSQPSTSSQGSGQDDYDAIGYVFMWGEGIGDGFLGGGSHKLGASIDALSPRAVGSSMVLDAQQIACGRRHAALITKQGEVFSWGEESGGWLGHGVNMDVQYPKLVEALSTHIVEFLACGEYHTCAVTQAGDLYSWGDGAHKFGLLGHGRDISHWTPKRIGGCLEGLQVSSVSCGPWHTALVTASGQLFTYGDGTFGVLGHGDRTSISTPKEIETLKGLKTLKAACGVWHMAAVVEVMVGYPSSNNFSSGKLFTWGDGDKGRLGHEDKEQRLVPTCVSVLIDFNFRQVACGHSLTVALTTSGHVFTIGSAVYGQLGDPRADGRCPVRVEGKLLDAVVEGIACGAYHVAALTSKYEVYTWGKGANGRLGHGDVEDKRFPALVEALKDKQVKSIACGSSFTAAICLHKSGSGLEQPLCASCRQPFSFTRKRHKCYNCSIVVCHACSSRKSYKASLAPNPNKQYRVCDSCYSKLNQMGRQNNEFPKKQNHDIVTDRLKLDIKTTVFQSQTPDTKALLRVGRKTDPSLSWVPPVPVGLLTWGHSGVTLPSYETSDLILQANMLHSRRNSPRRNARSVSPFSRRASPPRSTTPTPTSRGIVSSKVIIEDLKKANEALSQDIIKLRTQIENMTRQHCLRESELQKKLYNALASVAEESEKCRAAKNVIKSLTGQLKMFADKLPEVQHTVTVPSNLDTSNLLSNRMPLCISTADAISGMMDDGRDNANVANSQNQIAADQCTAANGASTGMAINISTVRHLKQDEVCVMERTDCDVIPEWVEQDEVGVYITLVSLRNGGRYLKKVRFSRRRFTEKQAESWWTENRARVFEKYNVKSMDEGIFEPKAGKH